jgi:FkbM family methyltransferase
MKDLAYRIYRSLGPAVTFKDGGRRYVIARDRASRYHIRESTRKLRTLASYVRPADRVIVDVGAHSGLFAAFAAERAPQAHIVCVEPDPNLASIIERNLAGADWELVSAAVGDEIGRMTFYRSKLSTQTSSLKFAAVAAYDPNPEEMTVATLTLDDVCRQYDQVDVLKVDIQGAEGLAIRGGTETIRKTRTVLIEVTLADDDLIAVLSSLSQEFGPWRTLNAVRMGADLLFERQ